ncbi:tRNA (mnm(5)s(2)U34)-methyltransferase [Methylobacter psychrophilus]|uniref:tRNA (mnm(5)s(2)U34)-methyltransferase n=1 Tax=Methylobacter psychrophilus TaxID=96941 RepID=UPI0021D50F21|nr:class I SAM-dependent methyltransferase [Methylobacter psychrophilus]
MQRISLVNTAHNFIKEILHPGAIAIDATVGNGHDTLFLVKQVSPSGKVFGFDIQQAAIESTRAKFLQTQGMKCLTLIQASHADMSDIIPANHHGNISVIMFNLGYLPGGDKNIITCTDSTITALHSACELLSSQGIITIMAYPGHSGGDLETAQVKNWCEQLDKEHFKIDIIYSVDNKDSAPRLFVIQKMH